MGPPGHGRCFIQNTNPRTVAAGASIWWAGGPGFDGAGPVLPVVYEQFMTDDHQTPFHISPELSSQTPFHISDRGRVEACSAPRTTVLNGRISPFYAARAANSTFPSAPN